MVIQGIREISLIIGIEEKDFEKAIRRLYSFRQEVDAAENQFCAPKR